MGTIEREKGRQREREKKKGPSFVAHAHKPLTTNNSTLQTDMHYWDTQKGFVNTEENQLTMNSSEREGRWWAQARDGSWIMNQGAGL